MGNQARQGQKLELWQIVSSTGNRDVQTRPVKSGKPGRQRRGNISNYNRSGARTGGQRAGNADQIQVMGPYASGTVRKSANTSRAVSGRTVAVRTRIPGTNAGRTSVRPAPVTGAGGIRTVVRSEYAVPGRQRAAGSWRTGAKAQAAKKKAGRRARISQFLAIAWIVAMSAAIIFMGKAFYQSVQGEPVLKDDKPEKSIAADISDAGSGSDIKKPEIREDFLTISEYNRPGTKLATVRNIFVHYTANKGTSAAQNRSYFESLGQTHERAASAHFIIGYEGEIVQCIPLDEEAYAVVERNGDSISIECCFLEEDGSFTQETYDSLIKMLVWLTDKYDLEPQDILRHYDCGGKKCPIYYVEHEDAWQELLEDVARHKL